MLRFERVRALSFLWLMLCAGALLGQRPQDGNLVNRRGGILDANLCRTPFYNNGKIGGFLGYTVEYPIGSGHIMLDGVAPLIVTRITDRTGQRHACCETAYGIVPSDKSPDGTPWIYEPLAGYCNENQLEAAVSDDPYTWPAFWPDKMYDSFDPGWPGKWNGYFGKGVKNADLETYFVIDDQPDIEFDYQPDAADPERHGLGTQMYIRGLQWNNVLTETHNFWIYEIENESTADYDSMYFALFADFKIGGDDEDVAGYNTKLDIAYCYDFDNTGYPGAYKPVAALCWAYLESPTSGYDGKDNDEDLMIDERRDDGLDNNGNWVPFTDSNKNGKWDFGEPLNDDLGADGIGPYDEGYSGVDLGEGDGLPSHGEPSFDEKDIEEGDMIGLTGFWSGDYGDRKNHDDDELVLQWCLQTVGKQADEYYFASNLGAWWHSGPSTHPAKTFQRFSFSMYYADGQTTSAQVDDAARKKDTVQKIYNANYRFAQPPKTPNLTAIPGDGKVYLYWDDSAESSFDRFFKVYDFEGYSLYRSTDPKFRDCRIITDGFGTLAMKKPIFRCDKIDEYEGFFPGSYNGVQFWIVNNKGLVHSYVDEEVINGQTYYYALCSFDYGFLPPDAASVTDLQKYSVLPSECPVNINIDVLNNVNSIGANCAAVMPAAPAAGYTPPPLQEGMEHFGPISNTVIEFQIFNPNELVKDGRYELAFTYPDSGWRSRPHYQLVDKTNSPTLRVIEPWTIIENNTLDSRYFDGLVVHLEMDTSLTPILQDWKPGGQSNMKVLFTYDENKASALNWDFDLVFTEGIGDTSLSVNRYTKAIPAPFYIYSITTGEKMDFTIADYKNNSKWDLEDDIRIVLGPKRGLKPARGSGNFLNSWRFHFVIPEDDTTGMIRPKSGDVFQVRMYVPPQPGEQYTFTTTAIAMDADQAKADLDKITVVPNPYVVTERWEPASPYLAGRGPMSIHFNRLPKDCTIKIYTVQGFLVDTIEHHSQIYEGTEEWDVISKDNMQIAPGNYIYHVEAPGVGNKIGRFMVIK